MSTCERSPTPQQWARYIIGSPLMRHAGRKGVENKMRVHSQPQPIQGLTTNEVVERRARGLGSVQPQATSRSYLQIIQENVFTSVNTILFSVEFALVLVGQ